MHRLYFCICLIQIISLFKKKTTTKQTLWIVEFWMSVNLFMIKENILGLWAFSCSCFNVAKAGKVSLYLFGCNTLREQTVLNCKSKQANPCCSSLQGSSQNWFACLVWHGFFRRTPFLTRACILSGLGDRAQQRLRHCIQFWSSEVLSIRLF